MPMHSKCKAALSFAQGRPFRQGLRLLFKVDPPSERPGLLPIMGGALPNPLLVKPSAAAAGTAAAGPIPIPAAPGAMSNPA